jgi:hypothetical protein
MRDSGRQGDREVGKAKKSEDAREVEEAGDADKSLSAMGLDCLLSIMPHYTMDVKSTAAGTLHKSFGSWWLEPLRGCGEDAIFAGFGPGAREVPLALSPPWLAASGFVLG